MAYDKDDQAALKASTGIAAAALRSTGAASNTASRSAQRDTAPTKNTVSTGGQRITASSRADTRDTNSSTRKASNTGIAAAARPGATGLSILAQQSNDWATGSSSSSSKSAPRPRVDPASGDKITRDQFDDFLNDPSNSTNNGGWSSGVSDFWRKPVSEPSNVISFDPMAQDTEAMRRSLEAPKQDLQDQWMRVLLGRGEYNRYADGQPTQRQLQRMRDVQPEDYYANPRASMFLARPEGSPAGLPRVKVPEVTPRVADDSWDRWSMLHNLQSGLGAMGIGHGADYNIPGAPTSIADIYGRAGEDFTWTPQQGADDRQKDLDQARLLDDKIPREEPPQAPGSRGYGEPDFGVRGAPDSIARLYGTSATPPHQGNWWDAPFDARIAANNGERPGFDGPVDWNGIITQLLTGKTALEQDREAREAAKKADVIPGPNPTPRPDVVPSDNSRQRQFEEMMRQMQHVSPNAYYPAPLTDMRASETPAPTDLLDPDPGMQIGDITFPRRDPRGYLEWANRPQEPTVPGDDMSDMVEPPNNVATGPVDEGAVTGNASPEAVATRPKRGGTKSDTPVEPTVTDRVVEGAGKLLGNTALGGIVSTLFPDQWNGMGEGIKGLLKDIHPATVTGNDISQEYDPAGNVPWWVYNSSGAGDFAKSAREFAQGSSGGHTTPVPPPTDDGGTDGTGTGGTGGTGTGGTPTPTINSWYKTGLYDPFGDVVFPGPGYRPGLDNEWLYFRRHMAEGGPVMAYADGGEVDVNALLNGGDARVAVIADAEDAIHNSAIGAPEPDDGDKIKAFTDMFGEDALRQLAAQVQSGQKLRPSKPRLVTGEGGPKDDAIPARIDNTHEARLSSGEFVFPAEAVAGAGDGDPVAGAQRLQQMAAAFSGKKPDDALNVEQVG